jgi:8-amino-7-oxononanoate synthase
MDPSTGNSADFSLEQKRALLKSLMEKRKTPTSTSASPAQTVSTDAVPVGHYQFTASPEFAAWQRRKELLGVAGVPNPFFRVHEGPAMATIQIDKRELVSFSNYNYLGLAGDPRILEAAQAAIRRHGTSVSASRLVAGEIPLHAELEKALAGLLRVDAALVFSAGYMTMTGIVGQMFKQGDLILCDSLIHSSTLSGAALAGAKQLTFRHNDVGAAETVLREQRGRFRRAVIVIEGVYSMDGDIPELARFVDLKKKYKTMLMVDEAHSIGTLGATGRGLGEYARIDPWDVDLWMGTLSKALASCGGYVAGESALIDYLRYNVPAFIYSAGISPANAAAALEATRVLLQEPQRVRDLRQRARLFLELVRARGFDTGPSHDSPLIPVILGDSLKCLRLAQALYERGVNVSAIIFPAVEEQAARLRFFITCLHTEDQLRRTVDLLTEESSAAPVARSSVPLA